MFDRQGRACYLCGVKDGEPWHVDHVHDCCPGRKSCGRCVVGIACATCNHLEGMLSLFIRRAGRARVDTLISRTRMTRQDVARSGDQN